MTDPIYNAYLLNSPFAMGDFIPRGAWDSNTTYARGDVVTYNGSSYVALQTHINQLPTMTAYWSIFASKGDQGIQGPTGPQGVTGSAAQWFQDTNTWTYGTTAGTNSWTVTVNADVTSTIAVGHRIWLTQSSTSKYFIVTAISYGAPNTTITLFGGTQYTLANSAISSPWYSAQKAPIGFPTRPDYWTITTTLSDPYVLPSPAVPAFSATNYVPTFAKAPNAPTRLRGVWTSGTSNYEVNDAVYFLNNTWICTAAPVSPYTTNPFVDTAHWRAGDSATIALPIGQWVVAVEGTSWLRGLSGSFYYTTIGIGTVSAGVVTPLTASLVRINSAGYSSLAGSPSLLDGFHDAGYPFRRSFNLSLNAATTYNIFGGLEYGSATNATAGLGVGFSISTISAVSAYL
jgi:hypothetical protein